jgi:hypothetical protein
MKKPKMVANLLEVTDVSIETLEARARLHDSRNKGPSKKKQQEVREVNTADHGDRGNRRNHQHQLLTKKKKDHF